MHHTYRWTLEKISRRLNLISHRVYKQLAPLPDFRHLVLPDAVTPPPVGLDVDDSAWEMIKPDEYWGDSLENFVLRTWFTIPESWDSSRPAAVLLHLGENDDFCHPEALVYVDGKPYAACDRFHREILLRPEWKDGKPHLLALHGWVGRLGNYENQHMAIKLYMHPCSVAQIDPATRKLVALLRVAVQTVGVLTEHDPVRSALLNTLDDVFQVLDTREPIGESFYASVEPALQVMESGIKKQDSFQDVLVHATGHAHIDVAWLWTLGQTHRKAERTFHTVIRLMEQFPDYHFSQSQPQLYDFIRQDQPELFETIRQRVQEGRWEPMGGMWVEADCNLSGAESLARQFLLGRTYFREQFGKDSESPVLWLPDVFGYAWALPQLIQQAGLKYFMTIKIGWNQYNRLPYDTFLWQGLDGTQILTHFSTVKELGSPFASTYNSMANPVEVMGAWMNFQQKDLHRDLLMAYGYGDGGGGPTREMLENIEIMQDFPGLPKVKQSSAKAFFQSIEGEVDAVRMPVWNGELYLEYHRGTYTTQAKNKRANRKSEFMLHDAEFLASWAALQAEDYVYPNEKLAKAWQLVCLNQFHDILPGSSIGQVYEESQAQYAEVMRTAGEIRDAALLALAKQLSGDVLLANPISFSRSDPVFIPNGQLFDWQREGKPLICQSVEGGVLVDAGKIAPYSLAALAVAGPAAQEIQTQAPDGWILQNDYIRVEMNEAGDLMRIFDLVARREVLPEGQFANQFQAFEDRPKDFDAWDVDIYYEDKMWTSEPAYRMEWVESGPLRQTVEIRRRILNSEIVQRVSLVHNSPHLDFDTKIQWNERHILLKVAFPVDILAQQATYDIQWGNVQRPTHRNTSWDWARFETCTHKWMDLSEGDYGVSLLNDCKYGCDVHKNVLRLTLLRSPDYPDALADAGEHHFVYSLLPHSGGWEESTQREAYALNDPVIVYSLQQKSMGKHYHLPSLVKTSASNVLIETIKSAEDGDGIIIRLYESQRKRGPVVIETAFPLTAAWETNLLEENQTPLVVSGNSVLLQLKPYQIVTVRLK